MKTKITESCGNVFKDLGFDDAEAEVLQFRSMLMMDLTDYIANCGLTQAQVAKKLGITQSRVSDLVRGKFNKFNLEMLIMLEGRLGRKVSLKLVA